MRHNTQRKTRKNGDVYVHTNFSCSTYSKSGNHGCAPHTIAERILHELVAGQIRAHAELVKCNESRIVENIIAMRDTENSATRKSRESELRSHTKRLAMLGKTIEKLYEDRVNGTIPETVFKNLIGKYEQERIDREQTVRNLEKRIAEIKENNSSAALWAKQIKQYTKLEVLDAETLIMLIDKIIVSEAKVIDGVRVCEIKIVYNHVGSMDWLNGTGNTAETEVVHEQAV